MNKEAFSGGKFSINAAALVLEITQPCRRCNGFFGLRGMVKDCNLHKICLLDFS